MALRLGQLMAHRSHCLVSARHVGIVRSVATVAHLFALLVPTASCGKQLQEPAIWIVPTLAHRCDLNEPVAARGDDAPAYTGLSEDTVGPPSALSILLQMSEGQELVAEWQASGTPVSLFAIDAAYVPPQCPRGVILEGMALGEVRTFGQNFEAAYWARQAASGEVSWSIVVHVPLDSVPPEIRAEIAESMLLDDRPLRSVVLELTTDTTGDTSFRWTLQQRRGLSTPEGYDEIPVENLLSEGSWLLSEV